MPFKTKVAENLSNNIKELRSRLQWTQDKLAHESKLELVSIKQIEGGARWPRPESLEAVSKALSVPTSNLLADTSPSQLSDQYREFLRQRAEIITFSKEISAKADDVIAKVHPEVLSWFASIPLDQQRSLLEETKRYYATPPKRLQKTGPLKRQVRK